MNQRKYNNSKEELVMRKETLLIGAGAVLSGISMVGCAHANIKLETKKRDLKAARKDEFDRALKGAYDVMPVTVHEEFNASIRKFDDLFNQAKNVRAASYIIDTQIHYFQSIKELGESWEAVTLFVRHTNTQMDLKALEAKYKSAKEQLAMRNIADLAKFATDTYLYTEFKRI
jgi:hypothetical protein